MSEKMTRMRDFDEDLRAVMQRFYKDMELVQERYEKNPPPNWMFEPLKLGIKVSDGENAEVVEVVVNEH